MLRRVAFFHPWLFALASTLHLYKSARFDASPVQMIRPLIVIWMVLAALSIPTRRRARDPFWPSLSLTAGVVVVFASETYALFLVSVILLVAALWLLACLARSSLLDGRTLSTALTLTAAALVAIHVVDLLPPFVATPRRAYLRTPEEARWRTETVRNPELPRDVYLLVLDGYARADVLLRYYDFDNSDFLGYLERAGFVVPARSHSNYPKTGLSVASTLNMNYMQHLEPGLADSPFLWLMSPWIDHSRVRGLFERAGYESVALGTDWDITDNPTVAAYFSPYAIDLTDFERYVLHVTPLSLGKPILGPAADSYEIHRTYLTFAFGQLARLAARSGPQFVFAHLLAPHPPFVFDRHGNPRDPDYGFSLADAGGFPGTDEQYSRGYIEQLEYLNQQLEVTIDSLLASAGAQPIILLQADHGPGLYTDFARPERTCNEERFGAFAAYYLPGMDPALIPPNITPVNLFRVVFNEYFGTGFTLLPDKQYSYTSAVDIYDTTDVTATVDVACDVP